MISYLPASCTDSICDEIYLTMKDKEGDSSNMNGNTGGY